MEETALALLGALVGGGLLGYFLTKIAMENTGIPIDERGLEISKLTSIRTLELVLLVTALSLIYSLIAKDERCTGIAGLLFAAVFFGNLVFRAYYSRKM
ncbi:DUF2178 domain-containing protein [Thermococcus sp.]